MQSVQWVKLDTGFFQGPKVKRLRRMPNGDALVLTYVNLLTIAGRQGATGRLMLTESLPLTVEDLAFECGCGPEEMAGALAQYQRLDMVTLDGDCYVVTGWGEHQSVGGSAVSNADRQRRYRERHRDEAHDGERNDRNAACNEARNGERNDRNAACNEARNGERNDRNVTRYAPELEIEKEKEKEKEGEKKKAKRGRFVPPTPDQVRAYAEERGLAVDADRFCDFYASKGWRVGSSPMRDWRAAARNWDKRDRASPGRGGEDWSAYGNVLLEVP